MSDSTASATGRVVVVGSFNVDHVWALAALPRPGEALAGTSHAGPGGKGFNQAPAAARAGAATLPIATGAASTARCQPLSSKAGNDLKPVARVTAAVASIRPKPYQLLKRRPAALAVQPGAITVPLASRTSAWPASIWRAVVARMYFTSR